MQACWIWDNYSQLGVIKLRFECRILIISYPAHTHEMILFNAWFNTVSTLKCIREEAYSICTKEAYLYGHVIQLITTLI